MSIPSLSALKNTLVRMHLLTLTGWLPHASEPRRPGRTIRALLALALVFVLVHTVTGSDIFSDVPDSLNFHDAINAIYDARITQGCGTGLYCPNDNVTRGQMAAFMNRGLGRVASDSIPPSVTLTTGYDDVATLTILPGAVTGGYVFVKVDATYTARISTATGCPCNVAFYISADGIAGTLRASFETVNTTTAPSSAYGGSDQGFRSGAATEVFRVPSGVSRTFRLRGKLDGGTGTVNAFGSVTAVYVPFGATGTDNL